MAIIATIHLPAGYDPRKAVQLHWIWPEDNYGRAEDVVAIQVEIADDLLSDNLNVSPRTEEAL